MLYVNVMLSLRSLKIVNLVLFAKGKQNKNKVFISGPVFFCVHNFSVLFL